MAYFGLQYGRDADDSKALQFAAFMREHFALADGPGHHDLAHYVDEVGFDTLIFIAYWDSPESFKRWLTMRSLSEWWNDEARLHEGVGYFREILCPQVERFETLFSTSDRFEGVARLNGRLSDEVQEHGYWGGMRDRFPIGQTDPLSDKGQLHQSIHPQTEARVRVMAHENIALIRSGQEWTETTNEERRLYLQEVEPVLREGMNFLRDHGLAIGCYSNRYMSHVDAELRPLQKSFGMSYWRSLEHMERWAESHPTHLAIFRSFMQMVQTLNFQHKLRLYHEVSVLQAQDQYFEYVNCHSRTGLTRPRAV